MSGTANGCTIAWPRNHRFNSYREASTSAGRTRDDSRYFRAERIARAGKTFFYAHDPKPARPIASPWNICTNIYAAKIYTIPSVADSKKAFEDYLTDAQAHVKDGRLKPGENVRMVDGRVTASSRWLRVMEVNSLLAKIIFATRNPDRKFYVEEGFSSGLDIFYRALSPHGLIIELHARPLAELNEDVIRDE